MIISVSTFNLLVINTAAARQASGKTIVAVDGKLNKANLSRTDASCPFDMSLSNSLIALFIQNISVRTIKKKEKVDAI